MTSSQSGCETPNRKIKSLLFFVLRIAFAVSIITWLVMKYYDNFLANLKTVDLRWLGAASVIYFSHMLICSWRWLRLTKVLKFSFSFFEAVSLTLKGYFFSLVIPGGALGGDVAKIAFLTKRSPKGEKTEAALSILADRMTGMAGLFSLAVIVILLAWPILVKITVPGIEFNSYIQNLLVLGLFAFCLAGIVALFATFFHDYFRKIKFVDCIMNWADKRTSGTITRLTKVIDRYRDNWRLVCEMCLLSGVFVHLAMSVVVMCIMKSLGMADFSLVNVIVAVTIGNIAGLLPLTISGVGLRDVTISIILAAGGISNTATIPVLYTAIILFFNCISGIFVIFGPAPKNISKTV